MPIQEFTQSLQLPELKILSYKRTTKLDFVFDMINALKILS